MICPRCQYNQDDSIPTCQKCNLSLLQPNQFPTQAQPNQFTPQGQPNQFTPQGQPNQFNPQGQQGFSQNNIGQPVKPAYQSNNSASSSSNTTTMLEKPLVKFGLIGLAVLGIIFVLIIVIVAFEDDSSSTSRVDNSLGISSSCLSEYSNTVTVGTAFDNFFSDGKWSNYESLNQTYVRYEGYANHVDTDLPLFVTIIFYDYGDEFKIKSVEFEDYFYTIDDYWGQFEIYELFEKIYSYSL